jgi:hypothetical protein
MTVDEAYTQVILSASLFSAILAWTEQQQVAPKAASAAPVVENPVATE